MDISTILIAATLTLLALGLWAHSMMRQARAQMNEQFQDLALRVLDRTAEKHSEKHQTELQADVKDRENDDNVEELLAAMENLMRQEKART